MSDDLTLKILIELREEMRSRFDAVDRRFEAVDRRFEALDGRIEATNDRLETGLAGLREEFHHRFVAMDLRQASQLSGLIASTDDIREMLVGELKARVG
jgi:hypothetical protein